jgi:hypothetical protein
MVHPFVDGGVGDIFTNALENKVLPLLAAESWIMYSQQCPMPVKDILLLSP